MSRADKRKFHYIYKTTCLVTNRYYIGMHSTDNLEDGYIGSGQRLWRSINKHGRDNHQCEIVEFLESRNALKTREREIVNEELLKDSQCMNLTVGGEGSFYHIDNADPKYREFRVKGRIASNQSEAMRKVSSETASKTLKRLHSEGKFKYDNFRNKTHPQTAKDSIGEKNSVHQTGAGNSQYGKKWIFSELEKKSIRILPDELDKYLAEGWKLGRRMKW